MWKFERNRIISLQITSTDVLSEAAFRKVQKNGQIWISCAYKALLSDGKNTVQAKQWLDKCYSDSASSKTTVKRCYADFKSGRTDTNDAERSGCPNSAVVLENSTNS